MVSVAECRQRAIECRAAMKEASLNERLAFHALAELWSELAALASQFGKESCSPEPQIRLPSGAHFLV